MTRLARGRRAEALLRAATQIGMDLTPILLGKGSARTIERLLHAIEGDFVPGLRDYLEELSRDGGSSVAIDSLQDLIGFSDVLAERVRTNALEQSDRQGFLEVWWRFQREAALWSDIKRLRDPSTGKIRPEFETDEDRQSNDFREASLVFFRNAGMNSGTGPALEELYELLQHNETTKHIAWHELNEAPHFGPLRRLTRAANKDPKQY